MKFTEETLLTYLTDELGYDASAEDLVRMPGNSG
jgi:hypothetical protein